MGASLKIIRNRLKDKPLAFLFLMENDSLSPDLVKKTFPGTASAYIEKQVANKNYLFFLPDIESEPVFIHIIKIKSGRKKYRLAEIARQAGAKLYRELKKSAVTTVCLTAPQHEYLLAPYAEGIMLSDYSFIKYKTSPEKSVLQEICLIGNKLSPDIIYRTETICSCVNMTRNLVNEPGSYLTAREFSREITSLGERTGFKVEVLNKQKIEALRMGGLLAVNRGSQEPPTFSILEWKPEKPANTKPLVLVGKGIVFDTGGLSLKPTTDSMDRMKSDMSGAAVVTGVLSAVAKMKLPVHIVGLVPATDNRPGENAYLPGDIIKMYNGSTVEVLNTDAEGRLILADALSYACKFEPELLIDIATLTGAASAATGRYGIVAFGKKCKKDFSILKKSGKITFERIIRFPLWDEYREMIESDVADLKNIGGKDSGAITAAKFLESFTNYPWIHLDIAGVSFLGSGAGYLPKGATGTGLRLIVEFIIRKYGLYHPDRKVRKHYN